MVIQKTPTKIDKIVSLKIGQHQENAATQIKMDVSDWITVHPTAGFHILFKRPGEVQAQPVLSSLEEGILTWTVQAWETALIGVGYAEVRAIEAESALVAKSRVIPCSVEESIAEDGDVPPEYSGWVERILNVADLADDLEQSIADGIEDIQAEGATQVGNVNTAGTTQVGAVQAKGTEVLNSIPADYSTLSGDVTDLKSALGMIETPQIVGMTDTGVSTVSSNLFQYATLIGYRKLIYSISNGKVVLSDATNSNTYLIPVNGISTYAFTFCRSAVVVSDAELTAVGGILNNVQSVNSAGGKYIVFSFNTTTYPESSYEVTKLIDKYKVPKDWDFGDITINAPQIDGMLPTGKTVESSNLFSKASLVASGKYVDHITNGKAVLADSTNLDTYIISVDGESTYTFTNCRTAVVVSDLEYTAVGNLLAYVTEINSAGGTYILFSFNRTTYPATSYKVTKLIAEYAIPNNWNLDKSAKIGHQRKKGTIASGGSLALTGKTAIKYGYQIIFKAFISAFNEIKLAFYNYNNSTILNAINITSSNLIIYVGSTTAETLPHGLTISNDISLVLDYRSDGIKVTLYSNGESFETTTTFVRLTSGVVSPTVTSNGTVCTSAVFEMTVPRAKKPVWYFGDSYISYTNTARWVYYLVQDGFDGNTLLNGYAGGTSSTTVMALTALLQYGAPKYAVFATGMNDGSDSASAPSTSWANARDNFISICESNGIEMIFATVPTVPSVNNEKKNEWVRGSGYRYIDFAKAVGADGTGAWYSGMLSADNVHPTEKGAKALFTQAITDFPEFLT